jgi:hypothetical protein
LTFGLGEIEDDDKDEGIDDDSSVSLLLLDE